MKTESEILANIVGQTRNLTHYYFNKLKETDLYHEPLADGVKLNSGIWIMAHLTWAENFLVLQGTGGPEVKCEWFEKVSFGSQLADPHDLPGIEEILEDMGRVHEASLAHIRSLSEAQLAEDGPMGMSFGKDKSRQMMIVHAIRHEGTHTGHLGWLCKINGIKTL